MPDQAEPICFDAPLNMLAAEAASRIAHMLGLLKMPGANEYGGEAERLRRAADLAFRGPETGIYST